MTAAALEMMRPGVPEQFSPAPVLCWHVIYTYPQHERAVHDDLSSRSVEVFLPSSPRKSRWKDRTVTIQAPLFPGYLFTRPHPGQRRTVLSAPGVIRVLACNGEWATIDDGEIAALKLCLERGVSLEAGPAFELGDHVRVRSGVLAGLEGRISRCKDKCRLVIPITMLHQSVTVAVAADDLEMVEPAQRHGRVLARL